MLDKMQIFIQTINHKTIHDAAVVFLLLLVFVVLNRVFGRYVVAVLLKVTNHTDSEFDDKVIKAFEKPIRFLLIFTGLYLALRYLPLSVNADIFINRLFRSLLIVCLGWGIYELAGTNSVLSDEFKEKLKMDNILISFFSKVIRFVIIAITFVLVANEWNYDINGFVAGLGLGGLAFALAAKDMLANIFGGIVIIMEKPFSIGDWIITPSVEGVVEDISFRSTRIREPSQALVTVPNSTLASENIRNMSKMQKRRLDFYIGLSYSTPPEKIRACVDNIDAMLRNHPEIHQETIIVNFEKYSESSLDVLVHCFTNTTVRAEYLKVRQDVNFKIMEILAQEGVEIAFPSRSVYLNILTESQ